ncbi:PTS IIA-like nitrogen regulatory protein PtsN [Thiopseudomonas denitrificans]|uniref:Phosphotransferase IIA-like nitrogen-regulatory protein PtsN n=1 Tax=Thiopseudomonas denitrificans TaxID=1501432 RepID=A0A4R6TRT2_9GAMM|nr:PTS IIA-like nitrogen regulatory protein PtsN [Thiopseudomonas denitrificans]TDQ36298.1 phosphotransferase IIA-like nitrogen-regulatory protein PtsN [Thiopseudomonas denitrificans]
MIQLENILTPARSLTGVPGGSKKRVLESIAALFAADQPGIDDGLLFDSLIAREKLGSTGFGNGIAIPHCRLAGCTAPLGAVLHLDSPVDFDAIDGAPVDLLFVLLVPETATEDHLALLRQIATLFANEQLREQLRRAPDSQALYQAVLKATTRPGKP